MDNSDIKDFQGWITLKERLHNINKPRFIHESDIWWYAAAAKENLTKNVPQFYNWGRTGIPEYTYILAREMIPVNK